jgi:hypothetical protein
VSVTLPTIPPLPQGATHDQQMRQFEAQMRVIEFQQRERLNADADTRNAASVAAHTELARVQDLARQVAERQAAASERMVALLEAEPPAASPAPPPAEDEPALVALVSTMTSTQRQNPAAAAAAAKAQLAAIRGQ